MSITIWHNPRCGKSRQTLELLHSKGVEPAIREYLKEPPSKADTANAIAAHPILLQRPVVVATKAGGGKRAAIGRPPEAVLALLK